MAILWGSPHGKLGLWDHGKGRLISLLLILGITLSVCTESRKFCSQPEQILTSLNQSWWSLPLILLHILAYVEIPANNRRRNICRGTFGKVFLLLKETQEILPFCMCNLSILDVILVPSPLFYNHKEMNLSTNLYGGES